MTDEEIIRRDVRKVQLNILIKLDEVCRKHGLRYYLAFGTCLGALRHKGFIPWDDDIDVLMPWRDALKLEKLQREFGDELFVQSIRTDKDYRSIAMRVRDSRTTCIEGDEVGLKTNKGIYVDIYPYYECSDNRFVRMIDIMRSNVLKLMVANKVPVNHGKLVKVISRCLLAFLGLFGREKTIDRMFKHLRSVRGSEILDYYGEDVGIASAITYPKEWFGEPGKLEFEGMYFNGPTEPEKYMTRRYGDYMQLPPEEKRVVRHTYVVLDPYKSYREYNK